MLFSTHELITDRTKTHFHGISHVVQGPQWTVLQRWLWSFRINIALDRCSSLDNMLQQPTFDARPEVIRLPEISELSRKNGGLRAVVLCPPAGAAHYSCSTGLQFWTPSSVYRCIFPSLESVESGMKTHSECDLRTVIGSAKRKSSMFFTH